MEPPPAPPVPLAIDLALELAADLPAPLRAAAGSLAAGEGSEALWVGHLGRWLEQLRPELPPPLRADAYSLGLCLCRDPAIAALNRDWRGQDRPTDVLAFAAQESAADAPPSQILPPPAGLEGEALELGDIVISLDTALRQAGEQGHSLQRELLFLASHGLLHLLGWDHPDEAALAAMLARQEVLLASVQR